jgi:Leucine-rich repeat (LRR) protein
LWLGKNKIEVIGGLESLSKLEQLDIQNNRLTAIGDGLNELLNLQELYLACNHITDISTFPHLPNIRVIDLSTNAVETVEGFERNISLEEFWLSSSALATYESVQPLTKLPRLTCLYLEHSPIAKDFEYRKILTRSIPTLEQLDATEVNRTIL